MPKHILVYVRGIGSFKEDVYQDANIRAYEIMNEGLRVWNNETQVAVFYPPHKIESVVADFSEDQD